MVLDVFIIILSLLFIVVLIVFVVSGLDDFFIDAVAYITGTRPRELPWQFLKMIQERPQKRFAIMIPAWDESNVIEAMLMGNIKRIEWTNYDIFVGVYPNDQATIAAVQRVHQQFPNVHAVVNSKNGPSSKGQMLNEIIDYIYQLEQSQQIHFDAFVMQDAEDVIHPKVLTLASWRLDDYDFIQIPVFSLPVSPKELVGGIYMDEFAELHTKDLLVRGLLGGAIPSAGVGTILSRHLIEMVGGFNEGSVTEDYELGIRSNVMGAKSIFECAYYRDPQTKEREYIATREYFPKKFQRSYRQKTRWTVGIVFQGWQHIGWKGSLANRYFLYRDRRGFIINIITLLGYLYFAYFLMLAYFQIPLEKGLLVNPTFLKLALSINLFFMVHRAVQRSFHTARVYGVRFIPALFARWPLAIVINSLASMLAFHRYVTTVRKKQQVKWVKTEHEIPEIFNQPIRSDQPVIG